MNIELKQWEVKALRNYFGLNDKTQISHWAFKIFDDAIKKDNFFCGNTALNKSINKCEEQCERCVKSTSI